MKAMVKVWGWIIVSSPVIFIFGFLVNNQKIEGPMYFVGVIAGFIGATFLWIWLFNKSEELK